MLRFFLSFSLNNKNDSTKITLALAITQTLQHNLHHTE